MNKKEKRIFKKMGFIERQCSFSSRHYPPPKLSEGFGSQQSSLTHFIKNGPNITPKKKCSEKRKPPYVKKGGGTSLLKRICFFCLKKEINPFFFVNHTPLIWGCFFFFPLSL